MNKLLTISELFQFTNQNKENCFEYKTNRNDKCLVDETEFTKEFNSCVEKWREKDANS